MYRRAGIVSMVALTAYLCCGATSPDGCTPQNAQIGPSKGEVIGVGVAVVGVITVATVVLVEVHKGHHTVKGCVVSGPNGLEVQTDNKKTYALSGDTVHVKTGDLVQMHGDKIKRAKNDAGDETFLVQNIKKDYGPCPFTPSTAPAPVPAKA